MILLLGADGYVGQAFARALRRREDSFIPLSRNAFDYTRFEFLFDYVRKIQPDLVINAEDYGGEGESGVRSAECGVRSGESRADGAVVEPDRMEMLQVNVLLPQTIARVCSLTSTPWAHLSSGNIYCGATVAEDGKLRLERDLSRPAMRRLFALEPGQFRGFTELDEPNYSFKFAPCTFYSGTKALAEEVIREHTGGYIWRLRLPFNEHDEPRNFLTQLFHLSQVHDSIQCLSQVDDCVNACLELWERRAAFGIYNVINPGGITSGEVVEIMQRTLKPSRRFKLLLYEGQTSSVAGNGSRSGCLLDTAKLRANRIHLRDVHEAIEKSLQKWQPQATQAVSLLA